MLRITLACALGFASLVGILWLDSEWGATDEDEVRKIVAAYVREHPEEIVKSVESYARRQQAAQRDSTNAAVRGEEGTLLSVDGLPIGGDIDGIDTVDLVYFFDYNCGYCRRMHPILERISQTNPDVRIIYRDFPILGPGSVAAARVGIALWKVKSSAFDAYYDAMKEHPGQHDKQSIRRILSETVGEDAAAEVLAVAVSKEADDPISDTLRRNAELAMRLDVAGTPFIYLKGHPIRGAVDAATLQAAVDAVRADQAKTRASVTE